MTLTPDQKQLLAAAFSAELDAFRIVLLRHENSTAVLNGDTALTTGALLLDTTKKAKAAGLLPPDVIDEATDITRRLHEIWELESLGL